VVLPPKLADVAKKAAVSTATVSRVLNNSPYPVSEKTRKRVISIARELGYRPNILAKSLAANRTYTLELFMDLTYDASGESGVGIFLGRTLLGVEEVAEKRGYRVILDINRSSGKSDAEMFSGSFPVAGAIVIAPREGNEKIPYLVQNKIPFIVVASTEYRDYSYVDVDNAAGASKATEYLLSLGHTDIICLGGPSNFRQSLDRIAGFRRTMRAKGLAFKDEQTIYSADWTWDNGYRLMRQILEERPKRPTAVFACNDMMAMGAIRAIKSKNLSVPDDISVVGFDDMPSSEMISPPLTTVKQPIYDISKTAAEVLIERIDQNDTQDVPYQDLYIPDLIIRESCAAIRG